MQPCQALSIPGSTAFLEDLQTYRRAVHGAAGTTPKDNPLVGNHRTPAGTKQRVAHRHQLQPTVAGGDALPG